MLSFRIITLVVLGMGAAICVLFCVYCRYFKVEERFKKQDDSE